MAEFLYRDPSFDPDENGNRVIINKRCVGPIEVIIYGITKENEYYLDWTFPECYPDDDELERDYKIISRDEMIEALDIEIETCKRNGNIVMTDKYIQAKKITENYKF
ncbi:MULTISPECIES: hypothetical protein [unclassified Clostridium]|uniref:hypothetical protein n=1 Tax=unclassified Clostridium TaxID=2614128 RepID=UPI000298386B|nr:MULTISPECIES: hypothetical protein [unclassified Clostridium]EKQ51443.1 MAG: hypothetical protein A370_04883 [Clostridium sp. Maddingley MBC34-26]